MQIFSPLEQFEIVPVLRITGDLFTITNSTVFGFLAVSATSFFLYLVTTRPTIIPNRWQSLAESLYGFVFDNCIKDILADKGNRYFPFIFTTFLFILSCNLFGMIPYTFTLTSHLAITFGLGLSTFIGINIIAFREHGLHFFSFFLPKGAPIGLAPFLVVIELISYVFRVMSLSIRLFANMMAGHTLLKILAGFGWMMLSAGGLIATASVFPVIVVVALTGLEFAIAFLQAYVWVVLVCIYLQDAINLH